MVSLNDSKDALLGVLIGGIAGLIAASLLDQSKKGIKGISADTLRDLLHSVMEIIEETNLHNKLSFTKETSKAKIGETMHLISAGLRLWEDLKGRK